MRLLTYWLVLVYICFLPSIICSQGYAQEFKEYVERYKASFINNPDGPLNAEDVVHLDFFPADSSYIFSCKCLDISYSPIIALSTYSGKTKQYQPYDLLECAYRDSIF